MPWKTEDNRHERDDEDDDTTEIIINGDQPMNVATIAFTHAGQTYEGTFTVSTDDKGQLHIELLYKDEDMEGAFFPYAHLSKSVTFLPQDHFAAKTYSENEGLVEQFVDTGYFTHTGKSVESGYLRLPILEVTDKFKASFF